MAKIWQPGIEIRRLYIKISQSGRSVCINISYIAPKVPKIKEAVFAM
jgi:hypothetical protein